MKTIELGGVKYTWRQILEIRREQRKKERQPQPTLFPLKEDKRPSTQQTASDRYQNPLLFD